MRKLQFVSLLRWIARIGSLMSLSFFTFSLMAGGAIDWIDFIGLVFFPFGIAVGLIIAWWREALGGLVSVGSLAAFYVWHVASTGRMPTGPWFLMFAGPGLLFLAVAVLARTRIGPRWGEGPLQRSG